MKKLHVLAGIIAISFASPMAAYASSPKDAKPGRLKANVEKLVSFGTRHTLSSATDPKRGIGAARKGWLTRNDVVNCLPLEKIIPVLAAKKNR